MTQVITGKGCFGSHLCHIGKESTAQCHHCTEPTNIAQHTLEFCPAWANQRAVLMGEISGDLSLLAVVKEIAGRESAWKAFSFFCLDVMRRKEEAERERERQGLRREAPHGAVGGGGGSRRGRDGEGPAGLSSLSLRPPMGPSAPPPSDRVLRPRPGGGG